MKDLVAAFPAQLQKALVIANSANLNKSANPIKNVFISGLGGSGIGGTIVAEQVSSNAALPIIINKDYTAPNFINSHTLAVICTYSGNTEETIQVLKYCIAAGAKVTVITSGGEAAHIAEMQQLDYILLPAGFPPRSCIGYSVCQILKILHFHEVCSTNYLAEVENVISLLDNNQSHIKEEAAKVAQLIFNKIPVIYTLGSTEGVAVRFRQQLNENSKMLCWHHVLPEMNHNELVGWTQKNDDLAVIVFRYDNDYYRTVKRLEVCTEVFSKYCNTVIEIKAKGATSLQQAIYMIHLGDWISCLIADIKNIDAMDISIINHLKTELTKLN